MITEFPHYDKVEGWLYLKALHLTSFYVSLCLSDTDFNSLEIGVYNGKYLIGIENLTPSIGRVVAIDVFNNQELNIDQSGPGNKLEIFQANVREFCSNPSRVEIVCLDSFDIELSTLEMNSYGLISIDGGHTARHTFSDLEVATRLMHPKGLVILDDILNQDWTGVVSGAVEYFSTDKSGRLVPFAIGFNKLFCCHFTRHKSLLQLFMDNKNHLMELSIDPFKLTNFAGHQILSLKDN